MCAIKITRDRLFHRAAFLPTDAQLGIQIDATWTSPGYARATKVPSSATRPDKGLPFSRILSVVSVQVATRRGFAFFGDHLLRRTVVSCHRPNSISPGISS